MDAARKLGPALVVLAAALSARLASQSTHLAALEGSAPPSVVEPTAGAFSAGLAGVWVDPTAMPRATGAFFGVFQSAYAGVRLFQAAAAVQWGPRWSFTYASTEISNLFDSTLTNLDPSLAALRARAVWAGFDATLQHGRFTGSLGLALAGDDNVGVYQTGTLARASLRIAPTRFLSIGAHSTRAIGGTIPANQHGREQLDLSIMRGVDPLRFSLTAAVSRGALWEYSESRGGVALAAHVAVFSRLDFGFGLGRYATSFGATKYEWQRAVAGDLRIANLRLGVRYSSTRLGIGSGYGVSLAYEPPTVSGRPAHDAP